MTIISILVKERIENVPDIQRILTKYGKNIISRLGLHNIGKDGNDLIVLVYEGEDVESLIKELKEVKNIEIKNM